MKKIVVCALSFACMLAGCTQEALQHFSSCSSSNPADSLEQSSKKWYVNTDLEAAVLPDDAEDAFYKVKSYEIDMVKPIVLLARKSVSGTNYLILCLNENQLEVLTISEDGKGNVSYTGTVPFELRDYAEMNHVWPIGDNQDGTYETNTQYVMQGSVRKQFTRKTAADDRGINALIYDRVAVLGSDAKSTDEKKEYIVLCFEYTNERLAIDASRPKCWTVLTVDDITDTENADIRSVYEIDPAVFAEQNAEKPHD